MFYYGIGAMALVSPHYWNFFFFHFIRVTLREKFEHRTCKNKCCQPLKLQVSWSIYIVGYTIEREFKQNLWVYHAVLVEEVFNYKKYLNLPFDIAKEDMCADE